MFHRLPFTVYYHLRYALPVLPVPGELALSLSKGPGEPVEGCALRQR